LKTQEETPGYMLGLAGIADFFLTHWNPIYWLTGWSKARTCEALWPRLVGSKG